jgi:hypothetical protein
VEEQPEGGRAIVSDAGESFPYLAELIDSRKENEHA